MVLAQIQRARRKVQARIVDFKCVLGDENDNPYADNGHYWVRRFDRANANGNSTTGIPFRVRSGTALVVPRGGRQVWVGIGMDGHLTCKGFVHEDLTAPGVNIDPRAVQPNDPYRAWIRLKQIQNFRALPLATGNTDSLKVQVRQLFYYTEEGDIVRYNGTNASTHIDLTAYVPAAGLQRYVVLWLRTYNPNGLADIQVTYSSTISSIDALLSFDELQECANDADADTIPIQAFRLADAQTTLTLDDTIDADLRQFMNMPQVYGFPNEVSRQYRIHEAHSVIMPDVVTITTGGAVQIQADGVLVILGTEPPECDCEGGGSGGGGMTDFIIDADAGTPETITSGETVTLAGDGETTDTVVSGSTWLIAVKPKALPKICDLRMSIESADYPESVYNGDITDATALDFMPVYNGGTFSLPVSGVWNYFDAGDIVSGVSFANASLTGDTTNASNAVTGLLSTEQLCVGMVVSGTGIPVGATVSSITGTTSFNLSANATATNTGTALTFTFPTTHNFDVFLKYSSLLGGVVSVYERWSNNTTRVVMPLPTYDYVVVSDNSDDLRFMGTIRATSTGFQKNLTNCLISNWNHPFPHTMLYQDNTDSWTYSTASWRQMRGQATAMLRILTQLYYKMDFTLSVPTSTTSAQSFVGIGFNSASAPFTESHGGYGSQFTIRWDARNSLKYDGAQGYYEVYPLEKGGTGVTFYGDAGGTDVYNGLSGLVWS